MFKKLAQGHRAGKRQAKAVTSAPESQSAEKTRPSCECNFYHDALTPAHLFAISFSLCVLRTSCPLPDSHPNIYQSHKTPGRG